MRKSVCGLLAFTVAAVVSAAPPSPGKAAAGSPARTAEAEVTAVMDKLARSLETKDMAALSGCYAHDPDVVMLGTDAAERWIGWDAVRTSMEKQFAAQEQLKLLVHDRTVKVSPTGKTAWVTELMDWDGVSGGERFDIKNVRMSCVLEKRQTGWVIVSGHASIGVGGQAVKY